VLSVALTNSSNRSLLLRFNGDTGSNYSGTELSGNGTSAASQRFSSDTSIANFWAFGLTSTISSGVLQVMSYANTNVNKTMLSASGRADGGVARLVGLWRSTAAIDAIRLFVTGGSMTGTVSLYGIKAA
jgi:hypothetical protein